MVLMSEERAETVAATNNNSEDNLAEPWTYHVLGLASGLFAVEVHDESGEYLGCL